MTLHQGEIVVGEELVRRLLGEQCPQWAGLELVPSGAGTENTMFRLGADLLVRLPRTVEKAAALRKERVWLPRLAPHLPFRVPEPVFTGEASAVFPAEWSVFRWIGGSEAGPGSVADWGRFGSDLAGFVRALHRVDLMGADFSWYRGGDLAPCAGWVSDSLESCRALVGAELDIATAESYWRAGLAQPPSPHPKVWLHGDLKPTNLLVEEGRLVAVIDFGAVSVGRPDAEHATVWDLPSAARDAYWNALNLDEPTWLRARAWAVAVAASGIAYYWDTFPAFVTECRTRLTHILSS
ncbi:aminoglycoside phosphotransferase family protein [Actinoplanes sichuanensis]|uniref:Aminoglycoside phosphotransferase family protein n=1 Tax=Actinoplanes sichuanensis TaxID=512349 RepID=A0ABW4APP3_9ACTN|nr:aminoglycoside phosphotransferase family protein [Actinoplanes sichuanensis]BEL04887.1 aminoglycoside phosphotransferase family protein [Actinoplanes sichuanensis]